MKLDTATRIPEERVAGILKRAAELDRDRRETITIDALRSAALDAGISVAAVDAALAEYAASEEPIVPPAPREKSTKARFGRLRSAAARVAAALRTPLRLGALLFVLGLASGVGEAGFVLAWVPWAYLALRAIRELRPTRRAAPFVLRIAVMTTAAAVGMAAGGVDEEVWAMLFAVAIPATIAGSAFIKLRLPRRFRSTGRELSAPAG